jgi:hypothetical protein
MEKPLTERQLQRQLTAAESLCAEQAEKIRKQARQIERLQRQVDNLIRALDEVSLQAVESV